MAAYADAILLKLDPQKRKLLAIAAPVVVGIFVGGPMLVKPVLKKMDVTHTESASYSQKEAAYKNILDLDKQLASYRADLGKDMDKSDLIENLNSFAGKSGLGIISISPDEKKMQVSKIEYMPIEIEAEGNFHQLAEFVSLAESMKIHMRVTALQINRETASDTPVLAAGTTTPKAKSYKMSLTLTAYFGIKGA